MSSLIQTALIGLVIVLAAGFAVRRIRSVLAANRRASAARLAVLMADLPDPAAVGGAALIPSRPGPAPAGKSPVLNPGTGRASVVAPTAVDTVSLVDQVDQVDQVEGVVGQPTPGLPVAVAGQVLVAEVCRALEDTAVAVRGLATASGEQVPVADMLAVVCRLWQHPAMVGLTSNAYRS